MQPQLGIRRRSFSSTSPNLASRSPALVHSPAFLGTPTLPPISQECDSNGSHSVESVFHDVDIGHSTGNYYNNEASRAYIGDADIGQNLESLRRSSISEWFRDGDIPPAATIKLARNSSLDKDLPIIPVNSPQPQFQTYGSTPAAPSLLSANKRFSTVLHPEPGASRSSSTSILGISVPWFPRLRRLLTSDYLRDISIPTALKLSSGKFSSPISPNPQTGLDSVSNIRETLSLPSGANNVTVGMNGSPHSPGMRSFNPYLEENLSRVYSHGDKIGTPLPTPISERVTVTRPALIRSSTTNFTEKFPLPSYASFMLHGGTTPRATAATGGLTIFGLEMEKIGRWTNHKWVLIVSISTIFIYGIVGLICVLGVWFQAWPQSGVISAADSDILVLITLASTLLLLTSLVGISGALLNSRPILAFYCLLLWPCFFSMLSVGYAGYKRTAFALDRKLSEKWSESFGASERLVIQQSLKCCGFYNPLHEATMSTKCYPRSPLPGCKGKLYRFEKANLTTIYSVIFSLVPIHIANIFVSLLCSNHVNRLFGKGLTPKGYRLTAKDIELYSKLILSMGQMQDVKGVGSHDTS